MSILSILILLYIPAYYRVIRFPQLAFLNQLKQSFEISPIPTAFPPKLIQLEQQKTMISNPIIGLRLHADVHSTKEFAKNRHLTFLEFKISFHQNTSPLFKNLIIISAKLCQSLFIKISNQICWQKELVRIATASDWQKLAMP